MLDPKFFELPNTSADISEIVKQIKDKEHEFKEACKEMEKLSLDECYKEDKLITQEVQTINEELENHLKTLDMYENQDEIQEAEDEARNSRNQVYSEYASTAYIPIQEELIRLGKDLSECLENDESLANLKKELDEGLDLDSPSESWWQI